MNVALVEFNEVGKKYHFSFERLDLKTGDFVVVETVKGLEVGRIYLIKELDVSNLQDVLKPILRLASEKDMQMHDHNRYLEAIVTKEVSKMAKALSLEMKVLNSEYTLDRKKLTIYFESENRVDFRDLVKQISEIYQTRIELRQIGPRDAAKLIGGIGPCGLTLCCTTFIGEFDTVSIKMAKNQQVALNPQKISGVCGKLLCCIKYEDDVYTQLKKDMPDIGQIVSFSENKAKVLQIDILKQKVKLRLENEDSPILWVELEDLLAS